MELIDALRLGDIPLARRLARSSPLEYRGPSKEPPLTTAALYGDVVVMRELLRRGAKPIANDGSSLPLMVAAVGAIPTLGQAGHQWQRYGVKTGRAEVVTLLADAGSDVNAMAENGETALEGAAALALDDVITVLLAHHADVAHIGKLGQTAFDVASRHNNGLTAARLMKAMREKERK